MRCQNRVRFDIRLVLRSYCSIEGSIGPAEYLVLFFFFSIKRCDLFTPQAADDIFRKWRRERKWEKEKKGTFECASPWGNAKARLWWKDICRHTSVRCYLGRIHFKVLHCLLVLQHAGRTPKTHVGDFRNDPLPCSSFGLSRLYRRKRSSDEVFSHCPDKVTSLSQSLLFYIPL